ncbi:hypothetical protein CSUI_002161 [Cystoisospora suis]|uniref:Uncharacterized protein n=1 Tax=Cystoisospora suis TaxID=483139 RepID=A0A2C6LA19_9APIC|nr:hypothetical protein CSUI_002161 [Cystoisospora suis]
MSKALNELELANLANAYAKLPVSLRHNEISQELSERMKYRMNGFGAKEIVLSLYPMYILVGEKDVELWRLFAERLEKEGIMKDLSVLNILSILRVYEKLEERSMNGDEFRPFIDLMKDIFVTGIQGYDAIELHDIVCTLSCYHRQTRRDIHLLSLILPYLDKKLHLLSLLHQISLLKALVKMKFYHVSLVHSLLLQLQDRKKIERMPPKYIALTLWIFARLGRLSDISYSMVPLMERNLKKFSCTDFARLAQALPPGSSILLAICENLRQSLPVMKPRDFCFFLCACVRLELLPNHEDKIPYMESYLQQQEEERGSGGENSVSSTLPSLYSDSLLVSFDGVGLRESILKYLHDNSESFSREDIRRVVLTLEGFKEDYGYILEERLPGNWADIGDSLDTLNERDCSAQRQG